MVHDVAAGHPTAARFTEQLSGPVHGGFDLFRSDGGEISSGIDSLGRELFLQFKGNRAATTHTMGEIEEIPQPILNERDPGRVIALVVLMHDQGAWNEGKEEGARDAGAQHPGLHRIHQQQFDRSILPRIGG